MSSTAELILQPADTLIADLQQEVLRCVDYLLAHQADQYADVIYHKD